MKNRSVRCSVGVIAALAVGLTVACGPAQVAVVLALEETGGEAGPLDDIEVRLLPYDRDAIFDSLSELASTPRPEVTAEQWAAREAVIQAQTEWREAEDRWNFLRDTVKKLTEELAELNPAMSTYRAIHLEYTRWEGELSQVERRVGSLFERYDSLHRATDTEAQAVRIVQQEWDDETFRDIGSVIDAKVEALGLPEAADTTGVEGPGVAVFQVPSGRYWVHARYRRPNDELYWNVEVTVARGDTEPIRLTESNAEVRVIF